jgi:eukaryotic-like serine/threonine-protein kinase
MVMPIGVSALVALMGFGLGALVGWVLAARRGSRSGQAPSEPQAAFELLEKIGEGSMGSVYRANHESLERPVAVKIANPDLPARLFEREAQLQAGLNHPNTAIVYDFGTWTDGRPYCAMELIEGFDLKTLVTRFGPQPVARVVRILNQVAAALAEAHHKNFVHQDINPRNIMITERGGIADFVKVLDFGVARAEHLNFSPMKSGSGSGTMRFVGTPGYAAPEVASGNLGLPSSDIFSLGAVGHFLLTGKGPFERQPLGPMLALSLEDRASSFEDVCPKDFALFLAQCLSREPIDRPLNMDAVLARLRSIQSGPSLWTSTDAEAWWKEHSPARQSDLRLARSPKMAG